MGIWIVGSTPFPPISTVMKKALSVNVLNSSQTLWDFSRWPALLQCIHLFTGPEFFANWSILALFEYHILTERTLEIILSIFIRSRTWLQIQCHGTLLNYTLLQYFKERDMPTVSRQLPTLKNNFNIFAYVFSFKLVA